MTRKRLGIAGLAAPLLLLAGCALRGAGRTAAPSPSPDPAVPVFSDATGAAGIVFRQGHNGKRPLTILETTGSGCAFLDYDNDGWLDLFLAGQPRGALFRNNGDGSFSDVTGKAGIRGEGFWIGCGTGDYDNDGNIDLFVTGDKICALYRNRGDGTFSHVTPRSGIANRGWQSSCAFGDLDRDGYLDLYVGYYVHFGPNDLQYCTYTGSDWKIPCGPDAYQPQFGSFYRNNGNGTFSESTRSFGWHDSHGKTWGIALGDYDNDGWMDAYVANDEMLGDLYHNRGRGKMENVGLLSGTAGNRDGGVQGGMGADFGDYDNDGRLDLVVTTFWMEPNSLYHNEGDGTFSEVSYPTGIATATLKRVGFGTKIADFNNDGLPDLFFLNGHVRDASPVNPEEAMPQRMQLFLNAGKQRFRDVSAQAGEPFQKDIVGRGAAVGDYDNDGDLDLAIIDAEGAARLLRNEGARQKGHWLTVRALIGPPLRDAIGARVEIQAGGVRQVCEIQTSGSIFSAHDPRAHFGLGQTDRIDRMDIRWPDGTKISLTQLAVDRQIEVQQGKGIVDRGKR